MNEKRPLYIPIKTLDSDDYIEGIGNLELAIIGLAVVVAIILGVTVAGYTDNNFSGIATGLILIILCVGIVRRDSTNENLIQKIVIIYRFCRCCKRYEYRHFNMLKNIEIEEESTEPWFDKEGDE